MLQDASPDFEQTWTFLTNRIQDVVNVANTAKQVQRTLLSIGGLGFPQLVVVSHSGRFVVGAVDRRGRRPGADGCRGHG